MGLKEKDVVEQRKKYGSNTITKYQKNSFFKLLLESLSDPIIKILLIALGIKIVFIFKSFDWFETLGILIAVFISSFISSISEYGSEAAFLKLQEENSKIYVKVIRDLKTKTILINDVVVGDVIVLASGDKIPADGKIIKGNLTVDESSINGESKEIKKNTLNNHNQVYRGSVVYSGSANVLITKVGDNTLYGKISKELQEKTSDSPLKLRLRKLAKTISIVGYIGAILASLSYLFMEIIVKNHYNIDLIMSTITNFKQMADYIIYALTLSVTIIVVAVPEGLPMMITLVLSSNMKKMLKDNVLVRKLVGIETSGSMNYLLTDKTGTLTKGKLEVIDYINYENIHYSNLSKLNNNVLKKVLLSSKYNNESTISENGIIGGNITDKAIMNFTKDYNLKKVTIDNQELFTSEKKYSSITTNNITYIKGASETLIPLCTQYIDKYGNIKKITSKTKVIKNINEYTKSGSRIIALVEKENNIYTYIGILQIKDEIREYSKEGIKLIENAGIKVIMITGDAEYTATSIAKELNLIKSNKDIVLTSEQFNKLSDEELKNILPNLKVIARSMPTDKSRLVNVLKESNYVVGMTGDGVNDAPALKKADVGFAMGSGTEVAKEASDIVILDNNILSISKAILYGRTIFKSIRKFIIYQLTVNVCALIISIVGTLIGIQNPITIIQMLWLNMIMDTFAGLAFSYEPPLDEYMKELPKTKDEPIMNKYMFSEILFGGFYSSILCILFLKLNIFQSFIRYDNNNNYLLTAYFAMFIFIGIVNAYNARTSRINVFANILKNKIFLLIFLFITCVQIYIIYFGGNLFRTYGLTLKELIFIIALSLTAFPIDILRKYLLKKRGYSLGV